MGILFNNWIARTRDLQTKVYYIDFDEMSGDKDANIRRLVEYMRWNMLAIDDELAEMRQAISWKPWQHDKPYADCFYIL